MSTPPFQKQTYRTNSDIRHDTANAHSIASGVHRGDISDTINTVPDRSNVPNTHAIISEVHRNALKNRDDTDGQNPVVSTSCTLPATEQIFTAA